MKRLFTLITLLLVMAMAANGQSKLYIEQAFDHYGMRKGCKMVTTQDATLHSYQLHVYKSLTYKKWGNEIRSLLLSDRKRAKKIHEVVTDGVVTSGYYEMGTTPEGLNRYVLYSQTSELSGTVIYIEGRLKPSDILKLCRKN